MKHKFITSAALAAALILPATANAQVFDRNVLIGAGLGGILGSNLAGGGVQDEGTAIGAVLGGLAGAAYSGRSSRYGSYGNSYGYSQSGFQGGLGGQPYYGGQTGGYGTFGGSYGPAPFPPQHQFLPAPQYVPSGQYVTQSYTIPSTTTHVYQPAPQIVQQPKVTHVYHAAQPVEPVVNRIIHHVPATPAPQIKTVHIYQQEAAPLPAPAPTIVHVQRRAPLVMPEPVRVLPLPQPSAVYCYAGSSKRYDQNGHLIKARPTTCSR